MLDDIPNSAGVKRPKHECAVSGELWAIYILGICIFRLADIAQGTT
jgi:hypothetical protein